MVPYPFGSQTFDQSFEILCTHLPPIIGVRSLNDGNIPASEKLETMTTWDVIAHAKSAGGA